MKKVDPHIHSIFSDGTLSPEQVVKIAKEKGISAISITDHDEISGFGFANKVGNELGITIIPGVEISAKRDDKSIHLLGYFIDPHNQELSDFLGAMQKARLERAEKVILCLKKYGINVRIEDIKKHSVIGSVCRPHIAEALVSKGAVKDSHEAFSKYLGYGKSCYVPRANISTKWVIQLILNAGGIPVLSHPGSSRADKLIKELVDEGLMGIEVWYPTHSESKVEKYIRIAEEYKLVKTGGSDSHGKREGYPEIGEFWVSYEVLEKLMEVKKEL